MHREVIFICKDVLPEQPSLSVSPLSKSISGRDTHDNDTLVCDLSTRRSNRDSYNEHTLVSSVSPRSPLPRLQPCSCSFHAAYSNQSQINLFNLKLIPSSSVTIS